MFEIIIGFASLLGVSVVELTAFMSLLIAGVTIDPILSMLKKNKSNDNDFAVKEDLRHLLDNDGMRISKNLMVSSKILFEHFCIFGPTGSGKSSSLFIPNLLDAKSFCNTESSLVITDLKGELYDITSRYQRSIGRNVKVFAPYEDNLNTIHYNPLDFCRDESDVISLAKDVLVSGAKAIELRNSSSAAGGKDSVWLNMASPLFASILIYVFHLPKPKNTISYALRLLISKDEEELEKLILSSENDSAILQYQMYLKAAKSAPTAGSIQVTLTSNVQSFLTPQIEKITAYTDFDFSELRDKKTALYVIYPSDKAFDLAPVLSIFFSQLFSKCKENYKTSLPIFCLFDEFSNCGQIPMFSMYASTLRSYKISLICCLQDKTQLKAVYGESSETIYNNLRNLCLFGGEKDYQTLKSVEMLCGNTEIINVSTTKNDKGTTTTTKSYKTQPLMAAHELKNIKEDEMLIMLKNQRPILDKINSYYKDYKYLGNSL